MTLRGEWLVTIPGRPKPKGSLKCVGRRGKRAHVLLEDNSGSAPWRAEVVSWIKRAGVTAAAKGQPLAAEVTFTVPRPTGHYGTGRNAHTVKASAPAYPTSHSTGDVDKLVRLILDALQDAELIPDDSAVVELTTRKRYPAADVTPEDALPYPGVRVRLHPL